MSAGEFVILIALVVMAASVAFVGWALLQSPKREACQDRQPAMRNRQVMARMRTASPSDVRCVLMDENQCAIHGEVMVPRSRRRPMMQHDGQTYAAASGSNETGFVYRRVSH